MYEHKILKEEEHYGIRVAQGIRVDQGMNLKFINIEEES